MGSEKKADEQIRGDFGQADKLCHVPRHQGRALRAGGNRRPDARKLGLHGDSVRVFRPKTKVHSLGDDVVSVIYQDRAGRLWVGTGEGGLNLVDDGGRVLRRFVNDPADPESLGDNYITALFEDRAGNVWIGVRRELMVMAHAAATTLVTVDAVVEIAVPDDDIVMRLSGRRSHPGSGRVYHVTFNPPKVEGKDDVTGDPLIQRDDDQEETVKKRLDVYHEQTEPLIDYYKKWQASGEAAAPKYVHINGVGTLDSITAQIVGELEKL